MMFLGAMLVFGAIFPGAFAFLMRLASLLFLIPLAFFGFGYLAWFGAWCFGAADWSMSSYMTYCFIFGTIPGLITAKMTLIG